MSSQATSTLLAPRSLAKDQSSPRMQKIAAELDFIFALDKLDMALYDSKPSPTVADNLAYRRALGARFGRTKKLLRELGADVLRARPDLVLYHEMVDCILAGLDMLIRKANVDLPKRYDL
ncbi:hypothetical protein EXIGLDRAFT_830276 [Exidia glandulosa HHB12029]|uniref:Uncharacterized protein n=1 Tax=Exidia glandulosa HHB12029 TaxID=1314781 RepID=A0A165NQR7_EXIGL|nr:hypothetical protein EXIGLDRAFT_830276 [Exidia glandulosa HHB12029]